MPYTLIDHTADMGIVVHATSRKHLFEEAAVAFCDVICDAATLLPTSQRMVHASGKTNEELMQSFLSELLFLFETEHELYPHAILRKITETSLEAELLGEKVDVKRHEIKTGIKAITYHQLAISHDHDTWKAHIIFDV